MITLVADKRLRSGLKAQQAHSPGLRPGLVNRSKVRPAKGKSMEAKLMYTNAFALAGRTSSLHHTQGAALGYVLVAPSGCTLNAFFPSGCALNACAYSLIQLAKRE